jgi:hypothetical protein
MAGSEEIDKNFTSNIHGGILSNKAAVLMHLQLAHILVYNHKRVTDF